MAAYLLRHLDDTLSFLETGRVSFFLDYDGTLAGITGRPSEACLDAGTRELICELASCFPIAIVSGRSLSDIKSRVGIEAISYAGCHGLEIESPDFKMTFDIGKAAKSALEGLKPRLLALSQRFDGAFFEDKGLSLTFHYRLLDPGVFPALKAEFDEAIKAPLAQGMIKLTPSRKAFEIRAGVDWDKGKALQWLLERPLFKGRAQLYMGDDDTDRDAYRAVGPDGITVNVGRQVEEARYYLKSQKEVAPFLKWVCRLKRRVSPD